MQGLIIASECVPQRKYVKYRVLQIILSANLNILSWKLNLRDKTLLIDIQTSLPPNKASQHSAAEALKKRMAVRPAIARMIDSVSNHSQIESRYFVVPDADEFAENKFYSEGSRYISPDTRTRMFEYENWSKKLSKDAVGKLLEKNKINSNDISRIITISCTGFFAPGLDYYLINQFGFPFAIKRTNIGFMGCAASIVGFTSILDAINRIDEKECNVLLISVELCSLHLQIEPTKDNILANMIFADGCAAALFSNKRTDNQKSKLKLISTDSVLFKDSEDYMGWKIGNAGFQMILSSDLPKIILDEAVPELKKILTNKGIRPESIKCWALHPGGRAILDSLQTGLMLPEEKMLPSRYVLRNFGNMSSASILFVLKRIIETEIISKGEYCCAVAFGPGLTMEVALFKGE